MRPIIALIAAWIAISNLSGCSSMRFTAPDGMTVREAYGGTGDTAPEIRVGDAPSPTARDRDIPLMLPPQSFACFVRQHPDPEDHLWIGDHWLYVELTPGGFFAEEIREGTPETRLSVTDREVEDLKALAGGLKKITVPYKKKGTP